MFNAKMYSFSINDCYFIYYQRSSYFIELLKPACGKDFL
jgi:hypothetical protein